MQTANTKAHEYVSDLSSTADHVDHFKNNIYPYMDARAHLAVMKIMEFNEKYLFRPSSRVVSYNQFGVLTHELGHLVYSVPDFYNDTSFEFNNLYYTFLQSNNSLNYLKENSNPSIFEAMGLNMSESNQSEVILRSVTPSGIEKAFYYGLFDITPYQQGVNEYTLSSANLDIGSIYKNENDYLLSGNLDSAGMFKFNIEYRRFNTHDGVNPFGDGGAFLKDGLVLHITSDGNYIWKNKMSGPCCI